MCKNFRSFKRGSNDLDRTGFTRLNQVPTVLVVSEHLDFTYVFCQSYTLEGFDFTHDVSNSCLCFCLFGQQGKL